MGKEIIESELLSFVEKREFEKFDLLWKKEKGNFSIEDTRSLLTEILGYNYEETDESFYEKILDLVIDKDTDLNFSIDNHAPTFLCLAIQHCSKKLLNYILSKNADINFIGDTFFGQKEEDIADEIKMTGEPRYSTCLDFAQHLYNDMVYVYFIEYEYQPDFKNLNGYEKLKDSYDGDITISQNHYHYLLNKSKYLSDLIELIKLIEIIIPEKGGRTYKDLMQNKI